MIQLTRSKLSAPEVILHDFDLPRICVKCGAKYPSHPGHCSTCGDGGSFEILCRDCDQQLEDIKVQYTSKGLNDVIVTKEYPADRCPGCSKLYLWSRWPDELDELVRHLPPGFRLLPEHGYQTSTFVEVFSVLRSSARRAVKKTANGISIRYGPQSSIFKKVADYVTEFDLADHGLEEFPTIRIRPPPPYSPMQTSALRLLLAQVLCELDEEESFYEPPDEIRDLLATVTEWAHDQDRRAAALATAIRNEDHPGVFVNAFRLLELVLERLLDLEIGRKRLDTSVSDEAFVLLTQTRGKDLKTRLQQRIESLPQSPSQIFADLWHIARPGTLVNPGPAVFQEIAQFRNKHVHRPDTKMEESVLPWESPDFFRFARGLLSLITFMLRHDPGGV